MCSCVEGGLICVSVEGFVFQCVVKVCHVSMCAECVVKVSWLRRILAPFGLHTTHTTHTTHAMHITHTTHAMHIHIVHTVHVLVPVPPCLGPLPVGVSNLVLPRVRITRPPRVCPVPMLLVVLPRPGVRITVAPAWLRGGGSGAGGGT